MKKIVTTKDAPAAIGPYSQAVEAGEYLFCSGQIPIDPTTGKLVDGDVVVQTERVLDNLHAVLAAAGLGFEHVVRTTIYLVDLSKFPQVNQTYGKRFPSAAPARATVQVAALPLGSQVEIDAVAWRRA
jgi:2-iminobutanoate/2-iminopropanoate deaminase